MPLRRRIYRALHALFGNSERLKSFRRCGSDAWIYRTVEKPYRYKLMANYCHDRWCQVCSARRGRTVSSNIVKLIGDREVRFLTLTLRVRHRDEASLTLQLNRLYSSFRRLRRSDSWRSSVSGGVSVVEIKWSERHSGWFVHLHSLVTGSYYPRKELSAAWKKASGDSHIVDVRSVKDHVNVVGYITKYLSKPIDNTVTRQSHLLREAIASLHHRRVITGFGAWQHARLTDHDDDTEWVCIGELSRILAEALRGDRKSQNVIRRLDDSVELPDPIVSSRSPPPSPSEVPGYQHKLSIGT